MYGFRYLRFLFYFLAFVLPVEHERRCLNSFLLVFNFFVVVAARFLRIFSAQDLQAYEHRTKKCVH